MSIQLSDHFSYKKLLKFTLPSILMMVFTSVYGIVDGLFVSNFAGDIPFKAINLIYPYIMIVTTVGFMFGSGGTALVANTYGEGDKERANRYFSLFVYVAFALGVILAVVSFFLMRPIGALLGAEGEILDCCVLYGRVLMCSLPFAILQYLFQSFCVAAEKPRFGLGVIVAAGCTNMALDAVLVILLPQGLKLMGAAIATAISQTIGGCIPLVYFFCKNSSFLRLGKTKFDGKAIWKACANGSSEFMSNVSMSLVGMLYNLQLLKYAGDDGVAAYGVMMYVSMIFSTIFIGYSIGVSPIISYHDGAGNHEEKKGILKKSLLILLIDSILMLIFSELLSTPLSKLFVGYSETLTNMTVRGLRIFSVSFLFMGFAIFFSSFFTALNDGLTSAIISFLRTLVFQLGAVLLLPLLWDLNGVWISVVVAEVMAVVFSVFFLVLKRKKFHY
ncbi:MAG: MATE family efflux transporter [Clostridia bacterium]|nr:MATE family efflux transporter [Clostridia bacterium]